MTMTHEEFKVWYNNTAGRVCSTCRSFLLLPHENQTGMVRCQKCNKIGRAEDFPKASLFHLITMTIGTLAEKLVYETKGAMDILYRSTIIPDKYWTEREAAEAATKERLKEEGRNENVR